MLKIHVIVVRSAEHTKFGLNAATYKMLKGEEPFHCFKVIMKEIGVLLVVLMLMLVSVLELVLVLVLGLKLGVGLAGSRGLGVVAGDGDNMTRMLICY